jgi:transposase
MRQKYLMVSAHSARLLTGYGAWNRIFSLRILTRKRGDYMLFTGIDVSLKDFKVRVMDASGEEVIKRFRLENNLPGSELLVDRLLNVCTNRKVDHLAIGIEATSIYGWHLQMSLAENQRLSLFNQQIYVFNPKVIANFKKAYVDLDKDDWTDAFIIADRLRFGRLPEQLQVDFRYLPLQRLTRFRHHLMHTITREKNYYLTNLFLKFSSLAQDGVFSNHFGATSEAVLLEFLSPEEIAARPLNELIDFLMEKGRNHFDNPAKTGQELKNAATRSYRLRGNLLEPTNLILATSLEMIHTLEGHVKTTDQAIAKELHLFPNTLPTMSGLGPVFSAGLIAEIANIHRFPNEAALAKYAGLTWRTRQSGDFTADDTPLTKTGNSYLRSYFTEAANSVRTHEPSFREFYSRKYKESKTHHHRRALVLTARKLVRVVDALLRSNQIYCRKGEGVIN